MKRIIVLLILILVPSIAVCSKDTRSQWKEMNISFETGEKIHISQDKFFKLNALSLTWNGKTIVVPKEELQGIVFPLIETLYLSFNEFTVENLQGVPYRVIRLKYESEAFGEFPDVEFLFYKGRYQERTVRKKITATSWKLEVKKPGKPVERSGTERVVQ